MAPKSGSSIPALKTAGRNITEEALTLKGMDKKTIEDLMRKVPPNPQTGRVEIVDLIRALAKMIVHESFWVLQLEPWGYADGSGNAIESSSAPTTKGARPTFVLYCYDDKGQYRITQQTIGLPDSKVVLEVIKKAIASPELPLRPCLPWFFVLSIKLAGHAEAIRPFLDSLPAPFHWRVETREEADGVKDGVENANREGRASAMALAEKAKNNGNKAFASKDRVMALKEYKEALRHLHDLHSQKPDENEEKSANRLQAICLSNMAAAHFIPGAGFDPSQALEEAKRAELADPSYNKLYIRQATAYQFIGNLEGAKDAIGRALKRMDLENDAGLVDRFIELITEGQGFSDDEGTFKNFILDVLVNDRKSSERVRDIKGLFEKRVNNHFKIFPPRI